jgi:hypothetical protein
MATMAGFHTIGSTDLDQRIARLIAKRVRGLLTPEEAADLENLLADRSRESRTAHFY